MGGFDPMALILAPLIGTRSDFMIVAAGFQVHRNTPSLQKRNGKCP